MTADDGSRTIDWRLGTVGFGYSDWAGVFYPREVKPPAYLSFYARHFNAVELDTTFHAAPDASRVRKWAASVPEQFRFCPKTPKAITHQTVIDRAIDEMRAFADVVHEMDEKLGVILIQFAPTFTFEQLPRLNTFLASLPSDLRFAVEFRNRTWGRDETLSLLRDHGCGLVAAEYLARPRQIHLTADFLYVRWIGQHQRFDTYGREQIDVTPSLEWWRDQILRIAPGVRSIWGFANNDFAGHAIATCNRFKALVGQPVSEPGKLERGELF